MRVCVLVSLGYVWMTCARVCFCVCKIGNTKGISSTSTDGCQRWRRGTEGDEGRSLHEGSVSMVTPTPQRTSKSSPPSTNVLLSRHARVGGGGVVRGRANGAGSRRRDLIGFLDNSWYQKQVRSSHSLAAREQKTEQGPQAIRCLG